MPRAKILVAISAHADDVELNAGGTVAKWAAEGAQIHVVMMTDNCSGAIIPETPPGAPARRIDPDKTMAVRTAEQQAACRLYGGKLHFMDYCQRHYYDEKLNREVVIEYGSKLPVPPCLQGHYPLLIAADEPDHKNRLADLLVSLKPDLVLAQPPIDLDPEHHAVASMAWWAFRNRKELASAVLRYWMPGSSCQDGLIDPHWDHLEDISEFFEKKIQLCACHRSQMTQVRWDMVRKRNAYFGQKSGVAYAEPFVSATREVRFG